MKRKEQIVQPADILIIRTGSLALEVTDIDGTILQARINDGYRLATSAFTTRWATPLANKWRAAPLWGVPSPGRCAGNAMPERR